MIWTLALIGAVALYLLMHNATGAAIGAALGYLLGRVLQLEADLDGLRKELHATRMTTTRAPAQTTPRPSNPAATTAATPKPPATMPRDAVAEPLPQPPPLPASVAASMPPPLPPVAARAREPASSTWGPSTPSPMTTPSLIDVLADWMRGGNPLARVGIVILFFGGAFLAKYAAEHSHFPIELRMAALAAGALALLIIGWRLRETRPAYAQTLQGGGIAGLYLTVFAATRLYELLPPTTALALLVLIAIAAAALAVVQDALALAIFGTAGGFMAPILLSTGSSNHVALFTYYTVLNLGVFAVAWFRAWRVLNLVGLVFTFGIVGLFRSHSYVPEQLLTTDGFLLLFFLLYIGITILFALRQKPDLKGYVSGSLVFGLPLATFAIHGSMVDTYEYGLAWSAAGFGAFYLILAGLLHLTRRENFSLLSEAFAALGVIFGSLAVPLAFDHQTTAATWAVEGAGLLWIGVRQDRRLARAFGLLLQTLGGVAFLLDTNHFTDGPAVLNRMTLGTGMLAIAGVLSGLWLHRHRENSGNDEDSNWEPAVTLWGIAWWFYGGFSEIVRTLPQFERGADLVLLAASAALLWLFGERLLWTLARRLPAALLPFAAAIGILTNAEHPLVQAGAIGWPLVFVTHYLLLYLREHDEDAAESRMAPWLHAGGFWLLAFLTAWELHWQVDQQVSGVWRDLPWGLAPALLLFLCARAAEWPGWPLQRHVGVYQQLAAPALAVWASVWLLGINLDSDGDPGRLMYLPLFNPLDIASVLVLLSVGLWWKQLNAEAPLREWLDQTWWPQLIAAGLTFIWLNAALIRALHYGIDTPLSFEGILHSIVVQAALSIFWGLLGFGAMIWSARRYQREVWMAGAALMSVVVIKLFLIDTSGSGTLARIAAFLSVGALLLLTGYLSPLPPRGTGGKESAP